MQYVFFCLCLFRILSFLFTHKGKQNLLETNKLNPTIAGYSELQFTQKQMNPDIHLVLVRQDHTKADVLDAYKGTKGGLEFRQLRFTQRVFGRNVHANQGVIETVGVQSLIAGHRFENVRQPSFRAFRDRTVFEPLAMIDLQQELHIRAGERTSW